MHILTNTLVRRIEIVHICTIITLIKLMILSIYQQSSMHSFRTPDIEIVNKQSPVTLANPGNP